ncbi:cupin domain-containing protein [Achromobacter sp. KS-M25]|nr:cupin domain-containing protein [Achromobacter aestuarii]
MTFVFHHAKPTEPPLLIPAIGLSLRVPLPPEMTGGSMTAIETVNMPGFGPPLHRHRETEIFRVLEGCYLFHCDGREFEAGEGDVVTIPGGAAHTFVNISDKPARQFIVITPGLDATAFFTQLGEIMRDGVPDKQAFELFGQRWDVEFLGPPLKVPG